MNWTFIPRKGFSNDNLEISLGCKRDKLRNLLQPEFSSPELNSRFPDEDDFHSNDGTTFIRIRYKDDAVKDLEFLSGSLFYEGIQLHRSTNLTTVREAFEALGYPKNRESDLGSRHLQVLRELVEKHLEQ